MCRHLHSRLLPPFAAIQDVCVVRVGVVRLLSQVQLQVLDKTSEGTATTVQILSGIVSESGVLGIFEGCPPQLFNAVLKEALLNMVRLEIVRFVAQLFRRARTLTK